jgi:hypothetical protein
MDAGIVQANLDAWKVGGGAYLGEALGKQLGL